MTFSRRSLLRGMGAAGLSAATLTSLGTALKGFQTASAADTSGYKALVCVFMLGGADCHDILLPYDQASYDSYANIRSTLLGDYERVGGNSRARSAMLPLTPVNGSQFGGRQFALPPEMSGLHGLFEEGNAAIVANTGPLLFPMNRTQWENDSVPTPKQLFSHNDQQSTWMASAPEGAKVGWGGRFADAAIASGANTNIDFSTITTLGNELFLTGETAFPYQVGLDGAFEVQVLKQFEGNPLEDVLRRHFKAMDFARPNLLERDIARIASNSIELNETFNRSLANLIPVATQFPPNFLGQQMRAIANTIAIRDSLFMKRQVFFAAIGGFDTHSAQATDLPIVLGEVDQAITAFYRAMQELGLGSDVTIFTASDFGRTLAVNGDGTDHGWGAHHFVVGNAVQGQTIYGTVPPPEFEHDQDSGGGRLIPTTSVEQYAEPLGRWFGLTSSEIAAALPNFRNFAPKEELKTMMARA